MSFNNPTFKTKISKKINALSKQKAFLFSLAFLIVFSFSLTIFAAPFAPGATLDPGCTPGSGADCTVAPVSMGSSITSATAGSILFAGTAGIMAQDNANLFWDDTNNRLGIGTTTPLAKLNLADDSAVNFYQDTYSSVSATPQSTISLRRAGGTRAGPANVEDTWLLGQYTFSGYVDGFLGGSTANIQALATENWTTTGYGTKFSFGVTPNGATSKINSLILENNGNIGIGVYNPTALFQIYQPTTGNGKVATAGTTTLTGTNTQFTNTFKAGDTITVSGETVRTIATIPSDTSLTVTVAFSTTASNLAYTLTGGNKFAVYGNGNLHQNGSFFASQNTTTNTIRLGKNAGNDSMTAGSGVIIGVDAGNALTTASSNTFIGKSTGLLTTTGGLNTFIGSGTGQANISSTLSTIVGFGSGNSMTGGSNVIIGAVAGASLSTGTNNTILGKSAGATLSTGSNNTILGASSTVSDNSVSSSIGLGASSIITASNQMVVGSSASPIGNVYIGNGVTNASPASFTLNSVGGSGANIAGANLILAGGKSTGSGAGGSLIFQTTPASASSSTLNTLITRLTIDSTGDITIASPDKGDGVSGPVFTIGRNSNATNTSAGSVNFLRKDGTAGYSWQDNAGNLRIHTSAPTNATDTDGVVVGAFTSTRITKQDIVDFNDTSSALNMIINAPLHKYRYKNEVSGYGFDNPLAKVRIGFIADEVPSEFMWGNSIDQVSINGLLIGSIKELNIKIQNISGLTASGGNESVISQLYGAILNLKELIVEKLTIGSSSKPTAITVYDKNGNAGCMTIEDVNTGATKIIPGVCVDLAIIVAPVISNSAPAPEIEPVVEPVLDEVADTSEPALDSEPIIEEPVVEPIPEPIVVVDPVPDPVVEPTPEPVVDPDPAPIPDPVVPDPAPAPAPEVVEE